MGFREALLKHIELQIIQNLIIDRPDIEYQNDVPGYEALNFLKFDSSKNKRSSILTILFPSLLKRNVTSKIQNRQKKAKIHTVFLGLQILVTVLHYVLYIADQ